LLVVEVFLVDFNSFYSFNFSNIVIRFATAKGAVSFRTALV
jgi:hypothetical protein